MQFNPPLIKNIEDVLPHIKDNPAFIVADKGWYKVIDYVYAHRDTFTNDYARECRGLKFRADTGELIGRPYHKFHNLGECAGYFTDDVNLNEPHVVLDKLDGSMIHFVLNDLEQPIPMTRMGYTNVGEMAHRFLIEKCSYANNLHTLITSNPTKTFIFEYVGPYNRIVVDYREEALIMTGIRDILTGEYTTFMGMQAYLARFAPDVPMVQPYPFTGDLRDIYADEEGEGAIVRFETGAMVKVKAEIYCRKHKSKELTETVKGVVQLIIDGNLDDILPQLEASIQTRLVNYQRHLLNAIDIIHEGMRHQLSFRKKMDQKEFALNVQQHFSKPMQNLMFMTRKSGDGYNELIKSIQKRYNKESDLVEHFEELGLPLWQL